MKAKTKTAAITALKWAAGLTAGFIIGPTIVILANGQGDTGGMIAEKLVVGAAWFPILFLAYGHGEHFQRNTHWKIILRVYLKQIQIEDQVNGITLVFWQEY
nr:hypothetical protein [Methylomarinum sp. Ch1-1]MDP4523101.1 hypothetical protein [Methylomarinum sp. Ch1-1]